MKLLFGDNRRERKEVAGKRQDGGGQRFWGVEYDVLCAISECIV